MDKPRIEALKAANPILEVARDLGLEVVRQRMRCPRPENHAHGDRTPSVTLSPQRGTFKCWVCPDVKGDVVDLVRLTRHLGFAEALRFLEARSPGGMPAVPAVPSVPMAPPAPAPASAARPRRASTEPEPTLWGESESAPKAAPAALPSVPGVETADPSPGLKALLELASPVRGKAAAWLKSRRIFKRTWDAQGLRVVDDYRAASDGLRARFSAAQLQAWGLFNADGNLRYYRHSLLLPYFDHGKPAYLQARALDPEVTPKELSLSGPIPAPYNARLLDGLPGRLYLCEGVIDTLTLLETGFPAVGVPGASNFKAAWVPRFAGKSVFVAFDADAAGEAGAAKVIALLAEGGVEAHRLQIPAGKDINEWLKTGGLGIRLE
jgi:DNA primase